MDYLEQFYPYYQDCFSEDYQAVQRDVKAVDATLRADPSILSETTALDFDSDFSLTDGCYHLEHQGAHFEFFFKSNQAKRLYVFLDGSRTRDGGARLASLPNYLSWSWYPKICANILCFEDPMYYRYPDVHLAWFYGTAETDYRRLLADVVGKIAAQLEIPVKNIVLYGRSGGGTAAFGTAHYLSGCTAVAVNPQVAFEKYSYTKAFTRITGIDLSGEDPFHRNKLGKLIADDPLSHYLLIGNLYSDADLRDHIFPLCAQFGIAPGYGITRKGNLSVWLYRALGRSTAHNSFENNSVFQIIDLVIQMINDGAALEQIQPLCRYANELWTAAASNDRKTSLLKQDLSHSEEEREKQQVQLDQAKQTADQQQSQIEKQKKQIEKQKKQIEKQEKQIEKQEKQIEKQQKLIEKQKKLIDAADSSFLYRISKFLRRCRKKLRSLVQSKQ